MSVTIKDIAKTCGVSTTTVSRVANGAAEGMSAKTRARILAEIESSGYQPNSIARSMITKKTNTMALLVPDICNPFFPELARGVGDACAKAGYHLFLCNTDSSDEQEIGQVAFLRERLVDGIIFTTQNTKENNSFLFDFVKEKYPFVLIERYVSGLEAPLKVLLDNKGGIEKLVDHLVAQGHKKIAFIGGPQDAENAQLRYLGYMSGLAKNGLSLNNVLTVQGDYKMQSGYDGTCTLLKEHKGEFTAILAANDLMAIGACNAIIDHKMSVPEEYSVVGFDNLPLSGMFQPRITTAGVSIYKMGQMAAEMLIARLAGNKEEKHVIMDCALVERNTVCPI